LENQKKNTIRSAAKGIMVWRDLNVRNKTNKQPFFIERLSWSEISWQLAANGEVLIINMCPFFFSFGSFVVFGFVLSCTVSLAIKICRFSSKCELGCQKFEIELLQ
jgi:hypothetical protein